MRIRTAARRSLLGAALDRDRLAPQPPRRDGLDRGLAEPRGRAAPEVQRAHSRKRSAKFVLSVQEL